MANNLSNESLVADQGEESLGVGPKKIHMKIPPTS